MGRQTDLQAIAVSAINTAIGSSYPVKYPNAPFVTPSSEWLRLTVLPNQPIQVALGESGTDTITGVFQIDVFTPKGSGRNAGLGIIDNLCEGAFKSGLRYTVTDGEVKIRSAGLVATQEETNWYQYVINVEFIAYLAR